jgi:lipid-binding SYLF domain-containing protein
MTTPDGAAVGSSVGAAVDAIVALPSDERLASIAASGADPTGLAVAASFGVAGRNAAAPAIPATATISVMPASIATVRRRCEPCPARAVGTGSAATAVAGPGGTM